jgi:hypothetical protein
MVMNAERDASDLGVSSWNGLDHQENMAQIIDLRLKADQLRTKGRVRSGACATSKQREAAKSFVRRSCNWDQPSQSKLLLIACHHCGAPEMQWCRRGGLRHGRSVTGRVCTQRGE